MVDSEWFPKVKNGKPIILAATDQAQPIFLWDFENRAPRHERPIYTPQSRLLFLNISKYIYIAGCWGMWQGQSLYWPWPLFTTTLDILADTCLANERKIVHGLHRDEASQRPQIVTLSKTAITASQKQKQKSISCINLP